ncbi:hypothetical protein ACWD3Z_43625 [Streptomyces sp. NPDC002740]
MFAFLSAASKTSASGIARVVGPTPPGVGASRPLAQVRLPGSSFLRA